METNACLYFSFWAIISITFFKLGFDALDKTSLSTSVSPIVMFIFKHALAIAVCHSSDSTFIQSKKVTFKEDRYHIWTLVMLIVHTSIGGLIIIYLHAYYVIYVFELAYCCMVSTPSIMDGIELTVDFVLKSAMMCFGGQTRFIPMLAVLIGSYTSSVWAAFKDEERLYEMLPVVDHERGNRQLILFLRTRIDERGKLVQFGVGVLRAILQRRENESSWMRILNERRKFVEFAVGMVGTIFFQNFFRLTSFNHVLAFLYLAVSWLGNIALLRACSDLGIFNFLLVNVIVGCTVSQFGLRGTTWIAYGASTVLYGLRLKLESVSLVGRGEDARVIVW